MPMTSVLWKLASPYDAYVSHVANLNHALARIRHLSGVAQGYEAGLRGSGRVASAGPDARARQDRFRARLAEQADQLSGPELEEFAEMLGGGDPADAEADRSRAETRLGYMARGIEEYLSEARREFATLEARHYNPDRPDVARQLRANNLPATTLEGYRSQIAALAGPVAAR